MTRVFVEMTRFLKKWYDAGLTDEDLNEFQIKLILNPEQGDVIPGTGGLRKTRVAIGEKGIGKRSGARVIYVDFIVYEKIYLFDVYPKNVKIDLSSEEKKLIKKALESLEHELKRKGLKKGEIKHEKS